MYSIVEDNCHLDNFLGYLRIVNINRDIFWLNEIAPILRVNNTEPETFWKVEAFVVIFLYKLMIAFTMYR